MTYRSSLLVAVLLIAATLAAGCTGNTAPGTQTVPPATQAPTAVVQGSTPNASPASITTVSGLVTFVEDAAAYARANGREKAVAAFNDPNGRFVSGNVHIFAVDYDGVLLADAAEPGLVGTAIGSMTDSFGVPVVRNLAETARFGKGFVSYTYPNPARNRTAEPRLTVVEDVDGTYYVAAGIFASEAEVYPTAQLNASAEPPKVDDLVAFVRSAVAYARANGMEKALAAFTDPTSSFGRGPFGLMAFDSNGTLLAGPPGSPAFWSDRFNLINYHDPDGVAVVRGMRESLKRGGGIYHTVSKVKVDGKEAVVPEIDYAEPVDRDWWIASWTIMPEYARLDSADLAGIQARNHTKEELYDLVNQAVEFAKANGKEATLAEIDRPGGRFVRGDLFVWAESTNGTVLADPFWKAGIGTEQLEATDHYGTKTTRVGLDAMTNGTGFSHALFPNTAVNGTADVPKLIYMRAVDETWWIGSGVYGVEVI